MATNLRYWQQHVTYDMHINMDVKTFQYKGHQSVLYFNNSPDDMSVIYYHLYFNAFQPQSEMDITLQNIKDPDPRMVTNVGTDESPIYESNIANLTQNEIGYINILDLTQDGGKVKYEIADTILKIYLNTVIKSGTSSNIEMSFIGQVPKMILRAGRDSEDGVKLSMAQWYPKVAEYDFEGWHVDPYIRREFYGVWGDFKITIDIDEQYIIAGTGFLQEKKKIENKKNRWKFTIDRVHDYTWAADIEYLHDQISTTKGIRLDFYYKNNQKNIKTWKEVQPYIAKIMDFYSDFIGEYPYKKYSIIQGGNGGMEYALCTLVAGDRDLKSLLRVIAHEMGHMWFQHVLATNETKHAWMDEGFTKYIEHLSTSIIAPHLFSKDVFRSSYDEYFEHLNTGVEEPQTTHSERYLTNKSYHASTYAKGEIFLIQLGYIIGEENLHKTLRMYFEEWKFKHPNPTNFKRIAEKISKINLEWYFLGWTQTTKVINYEIEKIYEHKDNTFLTIKRNGEMAMPIEVCVTYIDNSKELYYIPFSLMRGEKEFSDFKGNFIRCNHWIYSKRTYELKVSKKIEEIKSATIDKSKNMANLSTRNELTIKNGEICYLNNPKS